MCLLGSQDFEGRPENIKDNMAIVSLRSSQEGLINQVTIYHLIIQING